MSERDSFVQSTSVLQKVNENSALQERTNQPLDGGRVFQQSKATSTYYMVLLINLLVNIDHGVLPGGVNIIKEDRNLSDAQYGNLEAAVFLGNIIGSLIATVIYREITTKLVLTSVIALNAGLQLIFVLVNNYHVMLTSRVLSGCV